MFRKKPQPSLPRSTHRSGPPSDSLLVTLSDFPDGFDDKLVVDVCISGPGGTGSVQRVLSRQRQTLRAAVQQACAHAEQLAQECGETIVAPGQRPSLVHFADSEGGCTVCLNYDLGPRDQLRPRVVRSLRLFVLVRRDSVTESLSSASAARPLPPVNSPRSRPPPA